jgi:lysophospholipase L1-like esterase
MTVNSTVSSAGPYTCNGVTVSFPVPFYWLVDTDLQVTFKPVATGTPRTLVLNSDYTLSGAGNSSGGTLTLLASNVSGDQLYIERNIAFVQLTSYPSNSNFPASSHEKALDRDTMGLQQLGNELSRTLQHAPLTTVYDAQGFNIGNLADGVYDTDGATVLQAREIAESVAAGVPGGVGSFVQSGIGASTRTFQDKMREVKSIKDRGAVVNGSTDDLSAVNNALSDASTNGYFHVDLPPGTSFVSALPTNPAGAALSGLGSLVTNDAAFPGYTKRLDSYTDMGYAINREHLYRAYSKLFLGPAGASGVVNIITYGDSTVANFVASGFLDGQYWTENLIPELFAARGLNATCVNKAVAGTSWSDLPALSDVGSSVDLMIIKYGINDAINPVSTRLQTMLANMRAKLSAIRSAAGGSPATLSIIVMGPNATVDPANGRDEKWYEQLRNPIIDVCNQYGCAYFDTYAWLKDLRQGAGGNWMDLVSGVSVHPLDIGKAWQYGGMIDAFFPFGHIERFRSNRFVSTGVNMAAAVLSDLPPAYTTGITLKTCQSAGGWPVDGAVETMRAVDGYTIQRCYNFAQGAGNAPLTYTRTGTGGSWSPWSSVAVLLTLSNGGSSLGGYQAAAARRNMEGVVKLTGVITGGTVANGTTIMTLPAGYRPSAQLVFAIGNSTASPTVVSITSAGAVNILHNGDTSYMALDDISFYAAP